MEGNVVMIGQYDECLGINEYINGSQITGRYCMAVVQPSVTTYQCMLADEGLKDFHIELSKMIEMVQFKWGVCALAACSSHQLQAVWDFIENRYQLKARLLFDDQKCAVKGTYEKFSTIDISVLAIFLILATTIVISTMYDLFFFRHCKDKEYNLWMAFSAYTNTKRLLSTKSTDPSNVTCIYGLRVVTMAWVVLGHTYYAHCQFLASNNLYLMEWIKKDWTMFIIGAMSGVDTFFVISGFLIVYVTSIAKKRGTPVHILVFYGHRLVRLTPALAGMILVYIGLFTHFGDGPFWDRVDDIFKQPCLKNWWVSVLYIQNYYGVTTQCIEHAWYLSVDTQLYVLSPIFLLFLFKLPKTGLILITTLICACIAGNIETALHYDVTAWKLSDVLHFFFGIYFPTHLRAAPWLIGLVLGYLMAKLDDKTVYIKKVHAVTIWIITLIVMLLICYSYIILTNYRIPTVTVAIFNALLRVFWGICICWVIFACTKGYGGYINKCLSLPLFCVLSRITYGIYITHIFVIWFLLLRRRTHTYVDTTIQIYEFWGNYMLSIGLGFIWTLAFESPASILQSIAKKKADVWIQKMSPGLLLK
ncbi:hypothetical protein RI129_007402 [Pyrocoelia pectoralis]|uniref:Acyltransferase 3 domain-containing protein n=1 Tax=Pyrocoelia pectoralis TaxID=417401 RepID=A0AAN7V9L9_9COLE